MWEVRASHGIPRATRVKSRPGFAEMLVRRVAIVVLDGGIVEGRVRNVRGGHCCLDRTRQSGT